jgi:hypothetical protein
MELLLQLAVAGCTVASTALLHLVALALYIEVLQVGEERLLSNTVPWRQAVVVTAICLGLILLHAVEIWIYAAVYLEVGEFHHLDDALYFSTSSYATIGYGDLLLSRRWRVLGAIEGVNGIILLGWSTAFFVAIVQRVRALEGGWRLLQRRQHARAARAAAETAPIQPTCDPSDT